MNVSSPGEGHSMIGRKMLALDDALRAAGIGFAFGGAIALSYHVENPRTTTDIDLDIMVDPTEDAIDGLVGILERLFPIPKMKREELLAVGQVRFMWDATPVDIFTHTHEFHSDIAGHIKWVPFEGRTIPIVSALHLAVFKAFLDRPKDWVDIQEMAYLPDFPKLRLIVWLRELLGDDHRVARVHALESHRPPEKTFRQVLDEAQKRRVADPGPA
jgi:hypothetical protein